MGNHVEKSVEQDMGTRVFIDHFPMFTIYFGPRPRA